MCVACTYSLSSVKIVFYPCCSVSDYFRLLVNPLKRTLCQHAAVSVFGKNCLSFSQGIGDTCATSTYQAARIIISSMYTLPSA